MSKHKKINTKNFVKSFVKKRRYHVGLMPLSSQSNPRKLRYINTLRKIVDKKPVNRKKGTMKIKQKVWHVWSQSGYSN